MRGSIDEVKDVLEALNKNNCKYMIIGGMAVNIHGFTRATGDLDIWYKPTLENINSLLNSVEWLGYETNEIRRNIKKVPDKKTDGKI